MQTTLNDEIRKSKFNEHAEKNKVFVKPPKGGKALFFKIPSRTNPSSEYDLRVMPTGEVRCSCKAYVLAKLRCWHISEFLRRYNEEREKMVGDIKPSGVPPKKSMQKKPKPMQSDTRVRFNGNPSAKDMAIVDDLLSEKRVVPF